MSETFVYIIAHIDRNRPKAPVKIGISSNPEGRLRNLQTSNPRKLVLLAAFLCPTRDIAKALETGFHTVKSRHRLAGEWFEMEPMLAVEAMCLNVRAAFNVMLGDTPEIHAQALEYSELLSNEAVRRWKQHSTRNLNDNRVQH